MDINIKFLLDSNPNYKRYIRSNSYWYKILIRNPDKINDFIEEVKEKYKLRTSDKITDIIDKINMATKLINILK